MGNASRFPRSGVTVLAARRFLTPRMFRVTLRAPDFGLDWPIQQPGEVITLCFAEPGTPIVAPQRGSWAFGPGGRPELWRNFTVRRHDPAREEIDVDVVLHEPRGFACAWAQDAPIGAWVGYAGPRVDFALRPDAEWLLLCGDETALPAIAAILESAEPGRDVEAVVEVADAAEEQDLELEPNARVRWVHRDGAPPATTGHLAEALRSIALPDRPGQAWGAAESAIARDIRTVLREERGLPRRHVKATGYWLRTGDWILEEE
jgi:NADPH-dependent ferric siderophore reductase